MDRNMLIGFLLIGLIILAIPRYNDWVQGGRGTEQETTRAPQTAEPGGEAGATRDTSLEGGGAQPAGSGPIPEPQLLEGTVSAYTPRAVFVGNEVFRGEISTRGGLIEKWYLKDFRAGGQQDDAEEPGLVQLVGNGGQGLALAWDNGHQIVDLSQVEFVPDRDSLMVSGDRPGAITLRADLGEGRSIEKQLGIEPREYVVNLTVRTTGFGPGDRIRVLWQGRLGDTEANPVTNLRDAQVCAYVGGEVERYKLGKAPMRESLPSGVRGGWVGVRNKYFLVALIPEGTLPWDGEVSSGGAQAGGGPGDFSFSVVSDREGAGEVTTRVYLGPIQHERLKLLGIGLEHAMDLGWPVVRQIAQVMLPVLLGLYRVFPNYGLVIILFSVLVKIAVYPLTHKSYTASAKMQGLQPEMAALREQYKHDPQEMNKQTMKLMVSLRLTEASLSKLAGADIPTDVTGDLEGMRDKDYVGEKAFFAALDEVLGKQKANRYRATILKHAKKTRINPMGGCLPMLVQMPVFFALYQVLSSTIELRQAPFVWWLKDLSQPDPWKVLPVLMGLTSFIQQKMTMKDPKQKAMVYLMPVFMTFIFLKFASGLVLYWTMFNVLSMGQQALVEIRKKASSETG